MFSEDCIVSPTAVIERGVQIGRRVIIYGDHIHIHANARIDSGSIIAENVVIGNGAWVRPGAVVLDSVPANAIVEGNPAEVVGYQSKVQRGDTHLIRLIDIDSIKANNKAPARVDLGISNSSLYLMRQISDTRGSLTVGEVPYEIPFEPRRYFVVSNVPSKAIRGEHAHKKCEQFLMCLYGSCRILLDDGMNRCELILDSSQIGVYMPAMIWGTQYSYSPDAVLLVFASMHYDENDYIRSYESFLQAKQIEQL